MSGKQEAKATPEVIDLSREGTMQAMPDYVLKHMPKKWFSKMCQCCWQKEAEVSICLNCVDSFQGACEEESDSDTEDYPSFVPASAYAPGSPVNDNDGDSQM